MNIARDYWDSEYSDNSEHHANQNAQITDDFLSAADPLFLDLLQRADSILEVGCGTGHFIGTVQGRYGTRKAVGNDLSSEALATAAHLWPGVSFEKGDIRDWSGASYDVAICSNVLEHFRDPEPVLEKLLDVAAAVIILVPDGQPVTDGYEAEGGAGHVHTFTLASFENYRVLGSFVFQTPGWQHSSADEVPRQLAVALSR